MRDLLFWLWGRMFAPSVSVSTTAGHVTLALTDAAGVTLALTDAAGVTLVFVPDL